MIRECSDFKSLDSADIMERLNTHEEQEEEKRDLYDSSQRKNHALKVVAVLPLNERPKKIQMTQKGSARI